MRDFLLYFIALALVTSCGKLDSINDNLAKTAGALECKK